MKKIIYATIYLLFFQASYSQNKGVENSIFNIQTGVLGLWVNNETKIINNLTLESEIGLDAGIWDGYNYEKTGFQMTPVIKVAPKWYYNINKRIIKKRNTLNNGANFFTLSLDYHPDLFVISNYKNIRTFNQIAIIPKWGIRRNIGNTNFNYEIGIGLGYRYYLLKQHGYTQNDGNVTLDFQLRIGYTFKKQKI